MKKICLYRKENGNENLQGRYDNVEEAVSYTHLTLPTNREV